MDLPTLISAILLGAIEGLTEFLPVSSTGHLILADDLLAFRGPPGQVFEISIQLGAILAVCVVYWRRFFGTILGFIHVPRHRRFVLNVLLAFLPAVVVGAFAHDFITSVLFSPWVVSVALIVGGFAILGIERVAPPPTVLEVDAITPGLALKIGFAQVVSMIPGVSRAGATILGGVWLGLERKAATEFSFFLAVPTMIAATAYDLYKNREDLSADSLFVIAVGFVAAFIAAVVVVRVAVGFVGRHGFAPFAHYRIVVGVVMLAILFAR